MNKRGSHIDVIISFAIFIAIIIFVFAIIQPVIYNKQNKGVITGQIEKKILDNVSGNLTIISVSARDLSSACVDLKDFITNSNIGTTPHIIATNEAGTIYSLEVSSPDVYVTRTSASNEFFRIYGSSLFPESTTGQPGSCTALTLGSGSGNYSVNQIQSEDYVFEKSVLQLISYINADRGAAKDYFNVSELNNFGFNFTYQNKTSIGTTDNLPSSSNIYSQAFPVIYVTENASIESGSITIRIW